MEYLDQFISDLQRIPEDYNDLKDRYNSYVRSVQRYFQRGAKLESEQDYDVWSMLDYFHIPTQRKKDDLINYMDKFGLDWSDLNFEKALAAFGNSNRQAMNFVSSNINKLYR